MPQLIIVICFLFHFSTHAQSFQREQERFPRYRAAKSNVSSELDQLITSKGLNVNQLRLFIRAFKKEEKLEVWAKNSGEKTFILLKTFPFCYASGTLGPKRRRGDEQVPEGVYFIDRFNPASSFHLSLGINYPNSSDRIRGTKPLGGDIFIHGGCVSIGCIAISDALIDELYYLAVRAKDNGQSKIPVHIFPFQFSENTFQKEIESNGTHRVLWNELKAIHQNFEKNRQLPLIEISKSGVYQIR